MGYPLSLIVINLFLHGIESTALSTFQNPLRTYLKYVDDTLVIVKQKDKDSFLGWLNNQHSSIGFTIVTEETDRTMVFPDCHLKQSLFPVVSWSFSGGISPSAGIKPSLSSALLLISSSGKCEFILMLPTENCWALWSYCSTTYLLGIILTKMCCGLVARMSSTRHFCHTTCSDQNTNKSRPATIAANHCESGVATDPETAFCCLLGESTAGLEFEPHAFLGWQTHELPDYHLQHCL